MTRILMRAAKDPFSVVTPAQALRRNLIWNNTGNLVFSNALYKLLDTPGSEITTWRPRGGAAEAERINAEYDVVVIPLANAFRLSFMEPLAALTELIRALTIPVVVVGVGAQLPPSLDETKLGPIADGVRGFMDAVSERSVSVGVRGEVTQTHLEGLGYRNTEVIGCPSMFHDLDQLSVRRKVDRIGADSLLSMNVSPYVRRMAPVVARHAEAYPNLVYTAQDIATLSLLLHGVEPEQISPDVPNHTGHRLFVENRMRMYVDPRPWTDFLATRDFSFGTRIHGNIAAILAGTPAVVFAHDSRTLELARYFQIPYRLIRDIDAGTDAATVYAEADFDPMMAGHAERWRTFSTFLERNGLVHIGQTGEPSPTFDQRQAATRFPGAVEAKPGGRIGRALWKARRSRGRPASSSAE